MLIRKYDLTADHDQALAVLNEGLREQSRAVRHTETGRVVYQQDHLALSYDVERRQFIDPESWHVAEKEGKLIGIMRIMAESHQSAHLYEEHRYLLIQELDASPRHSGAGKALLAEAKNEAVRRGRTALVLQTPRGSEAHTVWYPRQGFVSWPEGEQSDMAGMILRLGAAIQ
jgi:hypothetical protein